jgi:hypothetical protein
LSGGCGHGLGHTIFGWDCISVVDQAQFAVIGSRTPQKDQTVIVKITVQ